MMPTFDIIGDLTAPDLDVPWFADHGRRNDPFRPPHGGERAGAVLVRRDGARIFLDGEPTPARFDMGANEALCAMVWRSLERVDFPIQHIKKATAEAAAEENLDRRASADLTKETAMPRATTDDANAS